MIKIFIRSGLKLIPILFILCFAMGEDFSPIETITKSELKDHIYYLGSDYLEGRLPGSEGYKQASIYMASQLKAAGLVPIMENSEGKKSYFQPVDFTISTIAPESLLHMKKGQKEMGSVHILGSPQGETKMLLDIDETLFAQERLSAFQADFDFILGSYEIKW